MNIINNKLFTHSSNNQIGIWDITDYSNIKLIRFINIKDDNYENIEMNIIIQCYIIIENKII